MAWTVPWNLIGLQVSGDVGGVTIYTDRFGQKVAFPKAPPDKPPSYLQVLQRESFRSAQASWMVLSADSKRDLEEACRKLSMPLTGQNLFMSAIMRQDPDSYKTVERQSGITLPSLP